MTGRDHLAIGVGTTTPAFGALQMSTGGLNIMAMIPALAAAGVGSLAPDLDHPRSLASMSIPIALIVYSAAFLGYGWYEARHPAQISLGISRMGQGWVTAAWTALAVGIVLVLVSLVLGALFGHRGAVHSIAAGLAATLLVAVGLAIFRAPVWLAIPFAWGWAAHLLADASTPMGLPALMWPIGAVGAPWSGAPVAARVATEPPAPVPPSLQEVAAAHPDAPPSARSAAPPWFAARPSEARTRAVSSGGARTIRGVAKHTQLTRRYGRV